MDSLKRSNTSADIGEKTDAVKKQKPNMELCPHSVKCYRRNPHHFKEYDHPHLSQFLYTDDPVFPDTFKQDHSIYTEQLKVLRDLKHIKMTDKPLQKPKQELNEKDDFPQTSKSPFKAVPLGSNELSNKIKPSSSSNSKETEYLLKAQVKHDQKGVKRVLKVGINMKEKLEICSPYCLFFTKVPEAKQTLSGYNCISFPDLVCPSLGHLEKSIQINFMIDVSWLIEQYQVHNLHTTPLTILYGYDFPMMKEYIAKRLPNVTAHQVKMKDPFGVHHSKIGIYKYKNDIRIVVSTANLYYEDWNLYNQGLWVSPALPPMDDSKQDYECAGPTGFKTDLLNYLKSYKLDILNEWIILVKKADFTSVKVYFVTSVPGRHFPKQNGCHAHRVGDLLSKHCALPAKTTPDSEGALSWGVIAQSSSLGTFGKTAGDWLRPVLLRALSSHQNSPMPGTPQASLSIVYPTTNNVLKSHFGPQGGGCLPYGKAANDKQPWLKDYLHVWKSDTLGRSRAMPHIKSYCRVSPCLTKLAWCLITSANISKAAWGGSPSKDGGTYIRSYEAGVLFMPHMFDEEYFYIKRNDDAGNLFPIIYDLPLESYKSLDEPWCN